MPVDHLAGLVVLGFDLHRDVTDSELPAGDMTYRVEDLLAARQELVLHLHMARESIDSRRQAPDVQVVHTDHAL